MGWGEVGWGGVRWGGVGWGGVGGLTAIYERVPTNEFAMELIS